jgi:hypothetical protein
MVNNETPSRGPHNQGSGFVVDFIVPNFASFSPHYQFLACIASSVSAIIILVLFSYSQIRVYSAHRQ